MRLICRAEAASKTAAFLSGLDALAASVCDKQTGSGSTFAQKKPWGHAPGMPRWQGLAHHWESWPPQVRPAAHACSLSSGDGWQPSPCCLTPMATQMRTCTPLSWVDRERQAIPSRHSASVVHWLSVQYALLSRDSYKQPSGGSHSVFDLHV